MMTCEQEGNVPAEIWGRSLPSEGMVSAKALGQERAWHAQAVSIKESIVAGVE